MKEKTDNQLTDMKVSHEDKLSRIEEQLADVKTWNVNQLITDLETKIDKLKDVITEINTEIGIRK